MCGRDWSSDVCSSDLAHESDLSFSEGPCNTVADDGEWARNALKEMFSSEAVKDRKHRAKRMAMTLDPDLAANHSMSPVAAYSIQIERNYKRITEEQKSWYSREIEEHAKQMFKLQ